MTVMENELVTIPPQSALELFTTEKAIDPLLARVRQEIDTFVPDVSTSAGRKAIASIAYKVARTKTYIDDAGKRLVAEQKEIPNKIDACRRRVRDTLDQWRDEVRKPLTEWEAAEEARIATIKAALTELEAVVADTTTRPSLVIRERLSEVEAEAITEQKYAEFTAEAFALKDKALSALRARAIESEKRELEAAELERLRRDAAERERREREERIALEAAEKAKRDAEAKAAADAKAAEDALRRERDASERRELELKLQAEQAERRAVEAEAKAKREAEASASRLALEAANREADKSHRAAINNAAKLAFVSAGFDDTAAQSIVELIALRKVPHVTISY